MPLLWASAFFFAILTTRFQYGYFNFDLRLNCINTFRNIYNVNIVMSSNFSLDRSQNKSFVINNKKFLKQYALKNHEFFGEGIIVINLLLLNTNTIDVQNISQEKLETEQEPTVHQPVSYIPRKNFWFKMISLKIKKKYHIDIQEESSSNNKFLVVFIKDASIEYFSIYSLKL